MCEHIGHTPEQCTIPEGLSSQEAFEAMFDYPPKIDVRLPE